MIDYVNFTITRNKRGWYITEYGERGNPLSTHGPFDEPVDRLSAMTYLIANHKLNQ